MKERILKVKPLIRFRTYDQITIPELKLSGKWLEREGFAPLKSVVIIKKGRQLIIKPMWR
jgi:hypothetical protein